LGNGCNPRKYSSKAGVKQMFAVIRQEIDFKAAPQRVYEALTDAKHFSAFTGLPAEIHCETGGLFSCFGGQIVGRILDLVPNRRIVQAWHFSMWPDTFFSFVRIELKGQGEGTRLILEHSGFPEENRLHLDGGWPKMYWEPLKKYLDSRPLPAGAGRKATDPVCDRSS
jgi:uncharacterized protein YndB with AHSA1/START domain